MSAGLSKEALRKLPEVSTNFLVWECYENAQISVGISEILFVLLLISCI